LTEPAAPRDELSRALHWDGCVNVRDLGGLPTTDGGRTRRGMIVRGGVPRDLTAAGWQPLVQHGIALVIDLRAEEELDPDRPLPPPLPVVRVPLMGERDDEYIAEIVALLQDVDDEVDRYRVWYVHTLERHRARFAEALQAIADAGEGTVLIHCAAGKDRTGLLTALLLRLAGVSTEHVADDYAESEAEQPAPREAMLGVLRELDRRYAGVRAYLSAAGLDDDRIDRLERRLRDDARASVTVD
jgi:hypothetical protein